LLVLRWQFGLTQLLRSRLIVSFALFFLPAMPWGSYLQYSSGHVIFTRGITTMLIWLGLAPFLIQWVYLLIHRFCRKHRTIFHDDDTCHRLELAELGRLQSPRFLLVAIPWSVVVTGLLYLSDFAAAPLTIRIWCWGTFGIFMMLAGVGFNGIFVVVTMMSRLCQEGIRFNGLHPDRFGGMVDMGSFAVKIAFAFSSGTLVFPQVFDMLDRLGDGGYLILGISAVTVVYLCAMIAGFVVPVMVIKNFVDREKHAAIAASQRTMNDLVSRLRQQNEFDAKLASEVASHYFLEYNRLFTIKDYSFDVRVLTEFLLSVAIPVAVTIIEIST